MTFHRLLFVLTNVLLVLTLGSCATTTSSVEEVGVTQWLKPSPGLRQQIEETAKRLPWTHGMERIDAISWFSRVGEPAYPTLLAMVRDPRRDVAGAALAALGATRDSRLVEPLHAIEISPTPENTDLVLERARTLLRLGDWQAIPQLIEGLRDDRLITRALCAQALYEGTHERFDFDPRGTSEVREKSIQSWQKWWQGRERDPLLKNSAGSTDASASARSGSTPRDS